MGKKKNTPSAGSLSAIRIGTRGCCTDDGVEGRISWANSASVKIQWQDGERVTWKRSELANKPIEFLDADQEAEGDVQPEVLAVEQPTTPEVPDAEPDAPCRAAETPAAEATPTQPATDETPAPTTKAASGEPNTTLPGGFAIKKRERRPKVPTEPKEKKLSAIDAAAKVLAETGTPMSCKELIAAMAAKGYWTSPGGRTPDATLHAAILRQITVKGEQSRFVKAAPGRFALRPTA